jgi:hypothetical protein
MFLPDGQRQPVDSCRVVDRMGDRFLPGKGGEVGPVAQIHVSLVYTDLPYRPVVGQPVHYLPRALPHALPALCI